MAQNIFESYIELLKKEVKPALGCTEPIAVTLAVCRAKEALGTVPERITVAVSANILKNGMGVGIPGTGMTGLHIAAALGAVCGISSDRLELLQNVCKEDVAEAKALVDSGMIVITLADADCKLYVEASAVSGSESASCIIKERHDNICHVVKNGETIFSTIVECTDGEDTENTDNQPDDNKEYGLTVASITEFSETVPYEDIKFILEAARLNKILADEGLQHNYGLRVGRVIKNNVHQKVFGDGVLTYALSLTSAASDARMAGCTLAAMSNSGSGNQGIMATMPIVAVAEKIGASDEKLARALVLSHLISIHIKSYLGRLSALCGCVVASSGSASGIVYLLGGSYEAITSAVKNMIGNTTGMVCDGAKVGCALKVSSGVSSAVLSAMLAMDGICISENDGIIDADIEKTIYNLGLIGSKGMCDTDGVMLDIMVNKQRGLPCK